MGRQVRLDLLEEWETGEGKGEWEMRVEWDIRGSEGLKGLPETEGFPEFKVHPEYPDLGEYRVPNRARWVRRVMKDVKVTPALLVVIDMAPLDLKAYPDSMALTE